MLTHLRKPQFIVWSAAAAAVAALFALSVLQHRSFHTGYDLAGVMQGLWALAFGESQFNTFWGTHNWLNHAYVLSLPVALVYRFVPSAYLLLLLQTVAIALCAPIVYRIALEKTNDVRLSVAFALGYLVYPVLHFANLFDFHWDALALPLLLLTLYANKSLSRSLLCAALAIACKEDIAFTAFAIGVYVALRGEGKGRRTTGAALCLWSVAWLVAVMFVLVPSLSGGRPTPLLAIYSAYGETPGQVVRFLLTHPLQTLRVMFVEHDGLKHVFKINLFLLFLPLLAPDVLLMALPSFAIRFLSTCEPHHTIYFHHSLVETALVFYAAILGARRVLQWKGKAHRWLPAALLLCLVINSALWGPFRRRGGYGMGAARFAFTERSRVLREICQQIPPNARLSVSHWLTPHLAHRRFVYMFPNPYQRADWDGMPGDPDYGKYTVSVEPQVHLDRGQEIEWVVIDKDSPAPAGSATEEIIAGLKRSGEFEVVRDDKFALVLRRTRGYRPLPNVGDAGRSD